jgi:hypothetical protein
MLRLLLEDPKEDDARYGRMFDLGVSTACKLADN